ncbi:Prion-like-(Q/N-rich)-domain-bearing protein [Caenorhabditis elegans]|uniref:Prion-like-(Q/N-rich)-domain-bearing protein n=2 Tax=Caenorhabditis elegans TaxID=6239 RepID=Q23447_CAEEL|nr:Prion-like-(Q/N-rich)-domain-bearing protein [Caenorhabditis elegans]CCD73079.1 Prion-like-(Q/N-rich)-domain-bearing protein [Caenorhabditis elegans]|eukprot:NP_500584.2 Uncharacterized protein CELE_ZK180.6 [Caenorhabditis elegans]
MKHVSRLLLLSTLFGTAVGCLPGLGLPGAGGGGCCSSAQPACGNPCGGGGAAPAPVYAAAPLAPAPFAAYPQAPAAPFQSFQPQQPQQAFGGFQPQQVQSGYAGAVQGGNFGSVQTGAVSAGGAYLAEPVQQQVQPLPLLGQPVAYEKTVAVAPAQQQEQVLNTAQVLTKVMPASAVLDEQFVQPSEANNIVSSIINTQTSYGDEQQATQTHHAQPQVQQHRPAASSSSSSSSSSASAEHHPTHQVRVPSASSSIESNEQRVVPESVIVKEIVQTFETTPYPKQVAVETAAPFVPQPVRPAPQPVQPSFQPAPAVQQQVHQVFTTPIPHRPFVPETFVEQVEAGQANLVPAPVQPQPYVAPAHITQEIQPAPQPYVAPVAPVAQEIHTIQPIQPAPIHPAPLQPAHVVQETAHVAPETKVVAEEDRIEVSGGSDYDQPSNIPANEQATVNELLATLDNTTPASNLDFNQVTVEPNTNQKPAIIQTEGDDYDTAPLNEDRKDVPTAEPSHNVAPSNPEPVAVIPEETAPIIPQPKPKPQVHLQPVAPAVRVEVTSSAPAPTIAFELPIEVHEVVTPQVPLNPEPAVIQTITEQPVAEVHVEVLPTSAAPVSQFFENITSKEDKETSQPSETVETAPANGNDYDEEKSVENKVSTETDAVPNLGEYGSKFAKVQGAETKQVSEPIQIETIENENPYGRKYWIF